MKTKYIFLLLSLLWVLGACKDDSAHNPTYGEKEIPYIYTNMPDEITVTAGEPMEFPIKVSPADGSVTMKWTLDGAVIGTSATLQYTINEPGVYALRFEVSLNNVDNFREYVLKVVPPIQPTP